MVAFAIVLEILLPTVVLGCFRRRKYMEMLAIKIIRSILTLPFFVLGGSSAFDDNQNDQ